MIMRCPKCHGFTLVAFFAPCTLCAGARKVSEDEALRYCETVVRESKNLGLISISDMPICDRYRGGGPRSMPWP